jgi:4-hydroxy-2-oxoheptanedioate aldolase
MPPDEDAAETAAAGGDGPSWNRIASLLAGGQVVFGIFSGEKTPETAMEMAKLELADFVFYSLESGPFDLPTMSTYQEALSPPDARGAMNPHPIALRIPPIRDGMEEAAERTAAGLDAGAYSIVFPHVETADEAQHAVASMRPVRSGGLRGDAGAEAARVFGVSPEDYASRADVWPLDPQGELVSMVLIEDQIGVANALDIVSTPGVSVAFPGPGDLRRAYEGDMEAVEGAIQTVLAACQEAGVPCGVTAGPDDIATRIEQGFRVFIVTSPEALAVGHQAAGR